MVSIARMAQLNPILKHIIVHPVDDPSLGVSTRLKNLGTRHQMA